MTGFDITDDATTWRRGFEQRMRASYTAAGLGADAVERMLDDARPGLDELTVAEITGAGIRVGHVAVTVTGDGTPVGRIGDLVVDAAHAGRGYERAARDWAERWCAERGARRLDIRLTEPAGELFGAYGVRSQLRARRPASPPVPLDGVTVRPMTGAEYPEWLAAEKDAYVGDIVRSGALSPEDAVRKSDRDFADVLPEGLATPDHAFLVLEAAGGRIGTWWLKHRHLPGVTYGFSLHVEERHRGKGYGRVAMNVGERATLAAGDSTLMLTVWGGNEVAMNLYDGAGYRIVAEDRFVGLPRRAAGHG